MIEEYLNHIKSLIKYRCTHYLWNEYVYLDVHTNKKLEGKELNRVNGILKTWVFTSEISSVSNNNSGSAQYVYNFVKMDLTQELRSMRISNLKELL